MDKEIVLLINKCHIFTPLTVEDCEKIKHFFHLTKLKEGEFLFHEGEPSEALFILISGALTAEISTPQGNHYLGNIEIGESIGELGVISGEKRTLSIQASKATTLLKLENKDFVSIANQFPAILFEIIKPIIAREQKNLKLIRTLRPIASEINNVVSTPNTILTLLAWKWKDIIYEAPFLARQGYDAIKISPPNEFIERDDCKAWWQMYQPVSYKLSQFYGSEDDFKSMLSICHSLNIKVYADFVGNHMASYRPDAKSHVGTNGTTFENYQYGPLNEDGDYFTYDDFYHTGTDPNGDSAQLQGEDYVKIERIWHLEHYELLGLPKLNLKSPKVIQILRKYAERLLSYGIDGFRIDAAKHVNITAFKKIFEGLITNDGKKPYIYQEYYASIPHGIDAFDFMTRYYKLGHITAFEYGNYLSNAIKKNGSSLQNLVEYSIGSAWTHIPDDKAVVVLDNHDTERLVPDRINYKWSEKNSYVLSYIFMLAWPYGIPKVHSSFRSESNDDPFPNSSVWESGMNNATNSSETWICQHRWFAIANMVLFRSKLTNANVIRNTWLHGDQIAFSRCIEKENEYLAAKGFIIINNTDQLLKRTFDTGLPNGTYYDIIHCEYRKGKMHGPSIQVKNYGFATIEIPPYDAIVIGVDFVEK